MSTHYIEEAERLADTVTIMSHGQAVAAGPPRRARSPSTPAARRSRSTARRRELAEVEAEARAARADARAAPARRSRSCGSRRANGAARGRAPPREPRGRVRAADRRGHRMTATARPSPRRRRLGASSAPRSPACWCARSSTSRRYWRSIDVLLDRRADDLPARLRLRLRLAGLDGRRLRLRRVRRHRHGRHRGAVLVGLPGDVRHVRQVQVPAHLRRDPRRAGRRGGARDRRGAVDRDPRRRRTAARRCSSRCCSGSTRRGGCCSCRHRLHHRLRLGLGFGVADRRADEVDRQLLLRDQHADHADVPRRGHVLPDQTACRSGRRSPHGSTRSTTASSSSAHAVLRLRGLGRPRPPRRSSSPSAR